MTEPTEVTSRIGIRRRSRQAVAALTARGLVLNLIGLLATIALARLLTPRDIGIVALGGAVVGLAKVAADGGLGAGLIRAERPPDDLTLGSMLGFQLATMGFFTAAIVVAATVIDGEVAAIAAVVALSLPMSALQLPATVRLERVLRYGPIARVDLGSAVFYYVLAIALAVLGAGAWSLAIATVAREVVAASALLVLVPEGRVRPRLDLARIRPFLRFGLQYQAVGLVHTGRDQGATALTAAIGGLMTVGLSNLLSRLLQLPLMVLNPLWRVSYSAYARLVAAGENHATFLERSIATVIAPLGVVCVALAASAKPLVAVLFGAQWEATAGAVPWAAIGLFVGGLASVTCAGYLYALGLSKVVLWSAVAHTAAMLLMIALFVPSQGVTGVGIGLFATGLVEATILGVAASRRSGARLLRPIALSSTIVVLASLGGAAIGGRAGDGVAALLATGAAGVFLFLVGASLTMPSSLLSSVRQARLFWNNRRTQTGEAPEAVGE